MNTTTFTTSSISLARKAMAGAMLLAALGAQAQSLSVLPSVSNVDPGDTFVLDVQGSGFAAPIVGGGFNLAFDPAILKLDSIKIPAAWEFAPNTGLLDAMSGTVTDVSFNSFAAPKAGDFLAAQLTFTAIGSGSSAVSLSGSPTMVFGDIDANVVNVAFNGGKVNVSAVPEAGSLSLLLAGLGCMGLMRRLRRV
jgi:hypothetical protein